MSSERRLARVEPFMPLRPVPRRRLIARAIIAPFLWLAALMVVAIVVRKTSAIGLGFLVALGALAVSMVVLLFLRVGRNRQRRRDAERR